VIILTKLLEVKKINKSFGKKQVLKDVSFSLEEGEILGFIGPNGAGKTTTIKCILGLQRIGSGSVSINGYDVVKDFSNAISRVGAIVESPDMYMYLSGRKNLEMVARMYKGITKDRIDEVIKLVGLEARINDKVSKYSLGMRQRLGIAASLIHSPNLLILDEPTNGLDPEGIKELRELLKKLAKTENVAVLISSHNLAELESFCNVVCIIQNGEVVKTSRVKDLKKNDNEYILELDKIDGIDNFWLVDYLKELGFKHLGFNKRFERSQPRYTFRLDLTQGIESITKNFHSTTKKVINKGNLYNLEVLKNDTKYIDDFYETMLETSKREGIVPYSKSYYNSFYEMLHKDNNSDIYIVYADIEKIKNEQQEKLDNLSIECDNLTSENKKQELKNQINKIEKIILELDEVKEKKLPLASIITTKYGNKVWTMHGGNHTYLRNLNANYLIYYEIIKDAVKEGYEKIDFFGTAFNPTVDDPEYGIFLFKSRLGGEYTEFIGEFDLVTNKTMYVLFTKLVPIYRKAVKKIKKIKNK
jgi:ABC-2 type transport system ATP-binding protein